MQQHHPPLPGPTPLVTRPFDPLPLCPAIVLGWLAFDMASFGMQGDPGLLRAMLPGTVVALLVGCIAGRLWQDWPRFMELLALLAGITSGSVFFIELPGGVDVRWLPRVILFMSVTLLGLRALASQRWLPLFTLAAALGALGSIALAWFLEWRGGLALSFGAPTQITLAALCLAGLPALMPRARSLPFGALASVLWLAAVIYLGAQATQLRRPDQPRALGPAKGRPNLLLVVLDTVRADHFHSYGYPRQTTPAIDTLVTSQATRYANATATSSWTLPSHASLLTGLYPDEHGATRPRADDEAGLKLQAWPANPLRADVKPLAERLQAEGYDTAAVVGNITFLRHEFGLDRGFAHYDDRESTYLPRRVALAQMLGGFQRVGALPYRDAETVTEHALNWLDRHYAAHSEAPFFLMLNYMDAHAPQLPPAPYASSFRAALPDFGTGSQATAARTRYFEELAYDRGLLYADSQLMRVLNDLRAREQYENTVVVITSDHGEAFGEHGYWLHGWHLHQETLAVPLLIKPTGSALQAKLEARPVTGADVLDLILLALGMPTADLRDAEALELSAGMLGQLHMTEALIERFEAKGWKNPGRHQISWHADNRKWIVSLDGPVLAFDALSDPKELTPLELGDEEIEAARAKARVWWAAHPPLAIKAEAMSGADAKRLGDLGYTGTDED